jgi:hypothetical protein
MDRQEDSATRIEHIRLLVDRLERLSADSQWAHKASGLRGALLHSLERLEDGDLEKNEETVILDRLLEVGSEILVKAASEIPPS